ncbi:hypothetical protein H5410_020971 [Solanum commersonii]|uniref:Uncharacterized protein n=1 Tax=Solanum commersonii TaxID=4109 RepID=A0A9J5ZAM4_SOLCO|nr:hypothetical protein H5410_020971 [Solanum commersonii]
MIRSRVNNNSILSIILIYIIYVPHILELMFVILSLLNLLYWLFREDGFVKAKITLWEESGPYIVIVTATTVKEFRGEITFASTAASKTHVNLPMDNINLLILMFAPKPINIQTI